MPSTPSRRAVLSAGALFLAGCSALPFSRGLRIGGVRLANVTSDPVSVSIRLVRDGTVVHDDVHELGTGRWTGTREIRSTWDPAPAVFEVTVRVSDHPTASVTYTRADADGPCTVLLIEIREYGPYVSSHAADADGGLACRRG